MSSQRPAEAARQPATFAFTPEYMERAKAVLARYPEKFAASAILPLLDLAQRQHGWVPLAAIRYVAEMVRAPEMRVMECATFYTMFNLAPVGRHHVEVCTNISCWLKGSDTVLGACRRELGVGVGETTKDGLFTLSEAECLGACVNAPMMQIGDDYYEDLDAASTQKILAALKNGERPKAGPQNGRRSCEPLGGATTLTGEAGASAGAGERDGAD
jgi:NADH-quinone oxidoreductase E subunit